MVANAKLTVVLSHPININSIYLGCRSPKAQIKGSSKQNARRNSVSVHGKQSAVGAIQLYDDKSQTALRSRRMQLYPSHITLLNFRKWWRHAHIVNGNKIAADQRATCGANGDNFFDALSVYKKNTEVTRSYMTKTRTSYFSIMASLRPLAKVDLQGLALKTCELHEDVYQLLYV